MPFDVKGLQEKAGPLPLWGWAIVAGGGIGLLMLMRRKAAAGGLTVLTPAPTMMPAEPMAGLGNILGGLGTFLCGLGNIPNDITVSLAGGDSIHVSNGIATMGGGGRVAGLDGGGIFQGIGSGCHTVPPGTGGDTPGPVHVPEPWGPDPGGPGFDWMPYGGHDGGPPAGWLPVHKNTGSELLPPALPFRPELPPTEGGWL